MKTINLNKGFENLTEVEKMILSLKSLKVNINFVKSKLEKMRNQILKTCLIVKNLNLNLEIV